MRGKKCIHCNAMLVTISAALILCVPGCDSTNPEETIPAIKILVPEFGIPYESYNIVYLVAQMDKEQIGSFLVWEYSTDSMMTWKPVTISESPVENKYSGDNFTYDVKPWIPENDSVKNTNVYIKAYDYDIQTLFDIKGPIKID